MAVNEILSPVRLPFRHTGKATLCATMLRYEGHRTTQPSPDQPGTPSEHRRYCYQKVLDRRKQPIRGLWVRTGRFLARVTAVTLLGERSVAIVKIGAAW